MVTCFSDAIKIPFQIDKCRCSYCHRKIGTATLCIQHTIEVHPEEYVAILWPMEDRNGRVRYKNRRFDIRGKHVTCEINSVKLDLVSWKLNIPTVKTCESPVHKIAKINTPSKCTQKQLFKDISDGSESSVGAFALDAPMPDASNSHYDVSVDEKSSSDHVLIDNDHLKSVVSQLTKLLPSVTKYLSEQNRLEEWITFFHLVHEGNFDLKNIAVQLFWDVVRLHKIRNIHAMRFSSDVKQFWTLGLQLFHSKFIRFMGGYKSLGQFSNSNVTTKEELVPEMARVNFVCPHTNQLRQEKSHLGVDCSKPGMIESNIDLVAANSVNSAHKICIDGKKIAPGFGNKLGEADLYGHETSPTPKEKRECLDAEMNIIYDTNQILCQADLIEKEFLPDLSENDRHRFSKKSIELIHVLSVRIRDLRECQCKKQMILDKLMADAGKFWMKSKYSYSISGVKTHLHRLGASITDLLSCIDRLGLVAAACNESIHLYETNKVVDLSVQENYICLQDAPDFMDSSEIPRDHIKQRSTRWFEERKKLK